MEPQQHPLNIHLSTASAAARSPSRLTSVLKFVVVAYVLGMVVLLVEQFTLLYSNFAPVDFWNILFLPMCWLYLIRIRHAVRFPFALGMWFILLGSFIGTFSAFDPSASIIVITKEVYLYVWFVTLAAVFTSFGPSLLRRVLLLWTAVVVLHGGLLIAQFVSPNFYGFTISVLGRIRGVDVRYIGRPAGFFLDPVWAALFQLIGFVPLLLVGLRRELSLLLGIVIALSILATASLGALAALAGASIVAVLVLLLTGGHLKFLVSLAAVATIAAGLFLFAILQYPDVLVRLEQLTVNRAAHTSGERLFLWGGGTEVLFSPKAILGVGPDNYRDFVENKTLHNDILEFGVERGVIGLLGLVLLASEALSSALKILWNQIKSRDMAVPAGVIFLAMLVGAFLDGNAHQIFHFRILWLGLALLEAYLFRMMSPSAETAVARQVKLWGERRQPPEKSSLLTDRRDPSSADVG